MKSPLKLRRPVSSSSKVLKSPPSNDLIKPLKPEKDLSVSTKNHEDPLARVVTSNSICHTIDSSDSDSESDSRLEIVQESTSARTSDVDSDSESTPKLEIDQETICQSGAETSEKNSPQLSNSPIEILNKKALSNLKSGLRTNLSVDSSLRKSSSIETSQSKSLSVESNQGKTMSVKSTPGKSLPVFNQEESLSIDSTPDKTLSEHTTGVDTELLITSGKCLHRRLKLIRKFI